MKIVFLTRKFWPQKGGMETFSSQLTRHYEGEKIVVHAGKRQSDIFWVAPYLFLKALLVARQTTLFHFGDAVLTPVAYLLKLVTKKPVVVTVHGLELTYASNNKFYQWLINSTLPHIDTFVAVSQHTAKLLRERDVPAEKITVIGHGVILPLASTNSTESNHPTARQNIIKRYQLNAASSPFIILTVGRLVKRKGQTWFVEHVLPQIANLNPIYIIVGTGVEEQNIRQSAADQNVSQNIKILQDIDDKNLSELYAGCDVFVMPNIPVHADVEGFGITALEAASHATPVIAADLEGIPDAIHHKKNGLLYEPQNATQLAKLLTLWQQNPTARQQFGQQAAAYTIQTFRWPNVAAQYQHLFQKISKSS